MNRLTITFLTLCIYFVVPIFAQETPHISGNILAKISGNHAPEKIVRDLAFQNQTSTGLRTVKQVSKVMNIWLFQFDDSKISENEMLRQFKNHPNVLEAQFNHIIQNRDNTPNDPNIGQQWQWKNIGGNNATADADVDAELAWDITTGGLTALGDTIVACVVDDGTALNHPDLKANLWKNHGEIPGDGIDNDGNGYIDDFNGWNINSDNDAVGTGSHGVNVDGMIGAVGNNGVGVTGINWNVKIMTVKYGALVDAEVIEAYDYPLIMRKLYNSTNGQKGAFVVVTNSSWGIDQADPNQYPLWCAYYDTLGAQGILSCAATTNNNANVDLVGDMPTACPSDFMVSVGRTNKKDGVEGGTGPINVDLGAPGVQIYTTSANSYTTTTGTSFSSPLAAGIIALMYSAPCANIATLSKSNPAQAALLMKKYLLDGVDKLANMSDKYLTGGRANAFNSLNLIMEQCGACQPPADLNVVVTSDSTAKISWTLPDSVKMVKIQYKAPGENWTTIDSLNSFVLNLADLSPCTTYELQIASYCKDSISDYTNIITFKTLGCCEPPTNLTVSSITPGSAIVTWDPLFGATSYTIHYKKFDELSYTEVLNGSTPFKLTDLEACTNYDVFITVICKSSQTVSTDTLNFKTNGCGACEELPYCDAYGSEFQEEWISNVTIDGVGNDSNNDGYAFYTSPSFALNKQNPINISITPSFSGPAFDEYFRAWIDYNQDGDFEDDGELVFDPGANNTTVMGTFSVPSDAVSGYTRMRIGMSFAGFGGDAPEPCGEIVFGEFEDYCVSIPSTPQVCDIPVNLDTLAVEDVSAKLTWQHPTTGATSYTLEYKPVTSSIWQTVSNILSPPLALTGLSSSTLYEWKVKSICVADSSEYSSDAMFMTLNKVATSNLQVDSKFVAYPNPASNQLNILIKDLNMSQVTAHIQTINGVNLINKNIDKSEFTSFSFGISSLPKGMYFIIIQSDGEKFVQKLIKQ